jgi:hypothetical protein
MKLTKNTIKRLIKEELAQGESIDSLELEDRFRTMLWSHTRELDKAIAEPLIGKLINTYEERGPVIKAYVDLERKGDYPLVPVVVVFEKYPNRPEIIATAGFRPGENL